MWDGGDLNAVEIRSLDYISMLLTSKQANFTAHCRGNIGDYVDKYTEEMQAVQIGLCDQSRQWDRYQ